jgi:hypothetical protein
MKDKYIKVKEFQDFNNNFNILINTFNHKITEVERNTKDMAKTNLMLSNKMVSLSTDICWIKKFLACVLGVLATLTGAIIIKFVIG